MAAKKNFSNINTDRVYSAIAESTADPGWAAEQVPGQLAMNEAGEIVEAQEAQDISEAAEKPKKKARKTYTEEETAKALAEMRTRGRKGVKEKRINLAFTPDNYDYIRTMSAANGVGMTALINEIINVSRERNAEAYQKAKANKREFIF